MQTSDQPAPAAESPTISDRIGALFEGQPLRKEPASARDDAPTDNDQPSEPSDAAPDDPSASDGAPDESAAPQYEEIDYEGERYSVPPKLKDAILRQSDYTKKTQEVAEQRRLVDYQAKQLALAESERKFADLVRDEVTQVATLESTLRQYDQLDWRSLSTDEMIRYKMEMDQLKERKGALERTVQGKHQHWSGEVQRAHADLLKAGMEAVRKAIPGFSEATVQEIKDFAISEGYSAEEVGNILDPRYVKTLYEAAQYRKLRASAPAARAAAQKAAPIGKATPAQQMPTDTRNYLNYRKALQKAGPPGSRQRQAIAKERIADIFGR